MLYVLLIVPHLLALLGLAAFAYFSGATDASDEDHGGWDPTAWDEQPPRGPEPGARRGMPAPASADPPPRRLRAGERLSELYPRRPRREQHPSQPKPRVNS